MSRNFLLSLILIAAVLLGWLVVEERQRAKALAEENVATFPPSESAASPSPTLATETSTTASAVPNTVTTPLGTATETVADDVSGIETAATSNQILTATNKANVDEALSSTATTSNNQEESTPPSLAVNELPVSETTAEETPIEETFTETPTDTATCSSLNETGLLAAFDGALAAFIAAAGTTYSDQYENLNYQLSSKSAVIEENQGVVTTNYTGTVQELSTGQDVSANGTITATFAWDGCTWQVLDYSF